MYLLDAINQIMPAAVMEPSTPFAPEIVKQLGDACVVSWDTHGHLQGDMFVNQYLLEMDFGKIGSPFMQVPFSPL